MDGLPANELRRVREWVTEVQRGGPRAEKARPAAEVRQRRTPTSPRAASREKKADQWAEWFYRAMRESGSGDPAVHLPDMTAKLEELIATKIVEEVAPLRRRIAELERAKAGSIVTAWKLNRTRYEAIPYTADGQAGPPLDLRGLFEQFWSETGGRS